jgi:hypothetical protein
MGISGNCSPSPRGVPEQLLAPDLLSWYSPRLDGHSHSFGIPTTNVTGSHIWNLGSSEAVSSWSWVWPSTVDVSLLIVALTLRSILWIG